MKIYLEIIIAVLMAVVLSSVVYELDTRTRFGKIEYKKKQLIIGVLFGLLSILGTETGIDVGGGLINVRDAAPLCAGLIFGGPAGIIAGLIGGIERYYAVYWGAAYFTREACTAATIMAGFLAAFLRKYMFEEKRPSWLFGPFLVVITEVFHMLLVFLLHMNTAKGAFTVVQKCTIPMIILNGIGVWLSLAVISLLSAHGFKGLKKEASQRNIARIIQRWLLFGIVIVFIFGSIFTYILQTRVNDTQNDFLLFQNLADVQEDIEEASDYNILMITRRVVQYFDTLESTVESLSTEDLQMIAEEYGVSEINYIDKNGIIKASTEETFVGFNMNAGKQSKEFMVLLDGMTKEYVQDYGQITFTDKHYIKYLENGSTQVYKRNAEDGQSEILYRKYAGIALSEGGFIQVGFNPEQFQMMINDIISTEAHNRHVGKDGYVVIMNHNFDIISDNGSDNIFKRKNTKIDYESILKEGMLAPIEVEVEGFLYHCMYDDVEGYYVFSVLPDYESRFNRDMSVYLTVFMEILIFATSFILIYIFIKKLVVDNIIAVNKSLTEITGGNLDVKVDVRGNDEFISLSNDINLTVDTLKEYIKEAEERIDQELEYARTIQYTSLPHVFPPFPGVHEFEIWAGMSTAKEVGGDFYDFYFVEEYKLAFLIADVSGKGIPAALFMMKAKTMMKNLASTGMKVNEVFMASNDGLCEDNEAEMFVTSWMGILNTQTGEIEYANAGHNDPLVYRRKENGKEKAFEYVSTRRNLVLGGMDGIPYRIHRMQLEVGDIIFIYTDGVTEATNTENELYGDDRLRDCLNRLEDVEQMTTDEICSKVKEDVDAFVGQAPQFDDITMMCLRYMGPEK